MKTKQYTLLLLTALAFSSIAQAQRKISERSEMTPGMLQPGIDLLPIVDTSAGLTSAGSKYIYPNTLFDDWGFTTVGKSIAKAPSVAAMKSIFSYGTAADLNHGTSAGNLVRLDPTTGKLPALDGSLLTNLPSGTLASQAEAEGGVDNVKTMTALRVKQAETSRIGVAGGLQAWNASLDSWSGKTAPVGSVVGSTDTQTLSSKTLASPKINLGGDATGDIYYRDGSGNFVRIPIGATGNVLGIASGLPSWTTPPSGGGGLVNFSESISTTGVNSGRPVITLAPSAAGYADIVIAPKAGGGISATTPDGTAAGGDKRGYSAIDFQTVRAGANSVASGNYSALVNGYNNTAAGDFSFIGSGNGNTITAQGAAILCGQGNLGSGTFSSIIGGLGNIASGDRSSVLGGTNNVADSANSLAGGLQASTKGVFGAAVRSSGMFSTKGDAQKGLYVLRRLTTDNTATPLVITDSPLEYLKIANDSTYSFSGMVSARAYGGVSAGWRFTGTIKRGSNAASTSLVGTVIGTPDMDAGAVGWALAITADTTNGALGIQVTGALATSIRWVATVETCEVGY